MLCIICIFLCTIIYNKNVYACIVARNRPSMMQDLIIRKTEDVIILVILVKIH